MLAGKAAGIQLSTSDNLLRNHCILKNKILLKCLQNLHLPSYMRESVSNTTVFSISINEALD